MFSATERHFRRFPHVIHTGYRRSPTCDRHLLNAAITTQTKRWWRLGKETDLHTHTYTVVHEQKLHRVRLCKGFVKSCHINSCFSLVSLSEKSLGLFSTILKQKVWDWSAEQNTHQSQKVTQANAEDQNDIDLHPPPPRINGALLQDNVPARSAWY